MHSLIASLLLVATLALAAPASKEDIQLVWRYDKTTSTKSLHAWNTDQTLLLGQSCDDKLDSGNFASNPLTFDVDDNGFGTVEWGTKKYQVHSNTDHSGGVVCHKRYNKDFARVDCRVPNYQGGAYEPIAANETTHCLPERGLHAVSQGDIQHSKRIGPGQTTTCQNHYYIVKVGEGNPHQNYWDVQLSVSRQSKQAQA